MIERTLILLAVSAKNSNFCVAGIDFYQNCFIRLVSNNRAIHGAIEKSKFKYSDGTYPKPLDFIRVFTANYPEPQDGAQTENFLFEDSLGVEKRLDLGNQGKADITTLVFPKISTFPFFDCSDFLGNYRYGQLNESICVVNATDIRLYDSVNGTGEKRTKITFTITEPDNTPQECIGFRMTDPIYFNRNEDMNCAILVISIGNESDNVFASQYKFVASIFKIN